jgi:hypothetical protein
MAPVLFRRRYDVNNFRKDGGNIDLGPGCHGKAFSLANGHSQSMMLKIGGHWRRSDDHFSDRQHRKFR